MPRLMKDLHISEMSGVDRAANLAEGWLMMKSISPENAAILAQAELLSKGIPGGTVTFDKQALAASNPDAVAYIESLEKALVSHSPAPTKEPTEEEVLAKALESLSEPVRKVLADTQRRATAAEHEVRKAREARELAEATAVAKALAHVPEVTDTFGETIFKARHGDKDSVEALIKALQQSETVLKTSEAFREIGTNLPAAGSAEETIFSKAETLRREDPKLTQAEAIAKAAEDPTLYSQHRKENIRRNYGGAE